MSLVVDIELTEGGIGCFKAAKDNKELSPQCIPMSKISYSPSLSTPNTQIPRHKTVFYYRTKSQLLLDTVELIQIHKTYLKKQMTRRLPFTWMMMVFLHLGHCQRCSHTWSMLRNL
eukprot:10999783-Ditylum_brightwellii.AAC.1